MISNSQQTLFSTSSVVGKLLQIDDTLKQRTFASMMI
jgi:hypothetical protein